MSKKCQKKTGAERVRRHRAKMKGFPELRRRPNKNAAMSNEVFGYLVYRRLQRNLERN